MENGRLDGMRKFLIRWWFTKDWEEEKKLKEHLRWKPKWHGTRNSEVISYLKLSLEREMKGSLYYESEEN